MRMKLAESGEWRRVSSASVFHGMGLPLTVTPSNCATSGLTVFLRDVRMSDTLFAFPRMGLMES